MTVGSSKNTNEVNKRYNENWTKLKRVCKEKTPKNKKEKTKKEKTILLSMNNINMLTT